MRRLAPLLLLLVCLAAALLARSGSTGLALRGRAADWLSALDRGDHAEACGMLTDSLAGLVSPGFVSGLQGAPADARLTAEGASVRGMRVSARLPAGDTRTVWLREGPGGEWRVGGDSSLDNLLGSATMTCSAYAMEHLGEIAQGAPASGFSCPVSGEPYSTEEGRLVCRSGHLGEGIPLSGGECAARRESLALMLAGYIEEGHPYPESFAEVYETTGGRLGSRGGYRCPVSGYSYYGLTPAGIHCPFHGDTVPVPAPATTTRPGEAPEGTAEDR